MDASADAKTNRWLAFFALFSSASTLVCCALPALFVSLGLGAAFAGLVGAVPQIIWFSEHKGIVFSIAGALIAMSAFLQYRARNAPCPLDQNLANACMSARKWSRRILYFSVAAYFTGVFFAFVVSNL